MRRLFDIIKGLVSMALTLGLLIGVPVLLAPWTASRFSDLVDVLGDELASDTTLVETLLTSGLLLVFWLAWLMLAVSILTEAVALVRGKVARRLPVFPGIQFTAARLVASCALVISSFGTAAPIAAAPIVPLAAAPAPANATVLVVDDTLTAAPAADNKQPTSGDRSATETGSGPVYAVEHGDTWWSMAERFLDDGLRWGDIVAANDGAVMADGSIISSATQSPRPGWHVALPEDAVLPLELEASALATAPAATATTTEVADDDQIRVGDSDETWDVERGDHFWKISDEALTEAWGRAPTDAEIHPFWVATVELNRDRLLPPEDPNMIYPAQSFALPEIPANPQVELGDNGNFLEQGPDRVVAEAPTEAPDTPATEAPEVTPDDAVVHTPATPPVVDVPSAVPQPAPPAEVPTNEAQGAAVAPPERPSVIPVPVRPQQPAEPVPVDESPASVDAPAETATADEADSSGGGFAVPAIIVSGLGLAAAGLLSVIHRLRARRVSERRPGKAPQFKAPTGAEAELQRSADPDALADVNKALRYLGTKLVSRTDPPIIAGVAIEPERILVLLDSPDPNAPAPFQVETNTWTLDRSVDLGDVCDAVAPLPALVTIGHTSERQFLLDLEHAGVVNLTGSRAEVEATMATMAVELAASPLADQLEIICVGFGGELSVFERITALDDFDAVATRLRTHVDELTALTDASPMTAATGRINDVAGDAWTPMVVFAPDAAADSELIALARQTKGAGVTALVTADGASTWQMHIKGNQLEIPHISVTVKRTNMTREQVADACSLLEDARNPEMVDVVDLAQSIDDGPTTIEINGGRPERVSVDLWDGDSASDEPTVTIGVDAAATRPTWSDVDFWVDILGPVRVTNLAGDELHFERSASSQLLAYLVRHRHGVTTDGANEAMYPNQEPNKNRLYNLASCARKTLGDSSAGEPYVPRAIDGMLHVSDRVGSDYERFEALVAYAARCGPNDAIAALREALELVRGEPFTGRGLDWAYMSGAYTEVTLTVDEAARAMATIALDTLDQPDDAAWATQQGLMVSPRSTELHLLRLRAALAREDSGIEPDAVWQHYVTVMEEEDDLPEGGSRLDERIVAIYESYRRSNPRRWATEASTA